MSQRLGPALREQAVPARAHGIYALCELLRERLRSGGYAEDGRLPDEFVLVQELGVSRTQLRAALAVLREEGFLTRTPGRGTFASRPRLVHRPHQAVGFTATVAANHLSASHEVLSASTWAMDPLTARDFGVEPGTPLHVIERLTRLDDEVLSFGAYVVRGDLAPGLLRPELRDRGLDMRDWLAAAAIVPVAHLDVTVDAVAADPRAAEQLGCSEGMPLLRMNRHFTTVTAELLAFGSATQRGDRFSYRAARQDLDLTPHPNRKDLPWPESGTSS